MPSRNHHTKSRHGCDTCKTRKVRCGLEKPKCSNCDKGSRQCLYPQQVSATTSHINTVVEESLSYQLDPVEALSLMHHYTAVTSLSMAENDKERTIWRMKLPQQAFIYRFLLDGLLALAALHRRALTPNAENDSCVVLARIHQQRALHAYIPLLQAIDEQNCHAIFASATVLGATSLALFRSLESTTTAEEVIDHVVGSFDLLVGARAVAVQARDWLHAGELKPMLGPAELEEVDVECLVPGIRDAIVALQSGVQESVISDKSTQRAFAYESSLRGLLPLLPRTRTHLPTMNAVIGWPVRTDPFFFVLVKEQDPWALVILAYYAVVLHEARDRIWFVQGIGCGLLQAVGQVIPEDRRRYLQWTQSWTEGVWKERR